MLKSLDDARAQPRAGGLGFAQIEGQLRHIGEVDEALLTIPDRDRADERI
jgi:hypothetical protein